MRKYLAAAALGASLMASQAAAYDSDVVALGDRLGSQSDTSDSIEGVGSSAWLFAAAAVILIVGVAVAASNSGSSSGVPSSP